MQTSPETPTKNNKRIAAAALVVAVAVAGVGSASVASSDNASHSAAGEAQKHQTQVDASLENIRLGDLADELAELGLELSITPAVDAGETQPEAEETQPEAGETQPEAEETQPEAEETQPEAEETQPEAEDGSDETEVDPFAGMTDAEIDALSDEEFFDLLDRAGIDYEDDFADESDNSDSANSDSDNSDAGDDEDLIARLDVDGEQLDTSDVSADAAERANKIWERFTKLIPAEQRQMVSQFELLSPDYGGAHVYVSDDDPTKWVLGVGEGLGEDLDYVLIHEFGHLLTLQAKEVAPDANGGSCPAFEIDEGCALNASTLNEFVQQFWPQSLQDEVAKVQAAETDDDYDRLFTEFYERHQDSFVTDYATTNPVEDLAETFAVFVTQDPPTGSTVADQKLELLWNDVEMVALRAQIRANQN